MSSFIADAQDEIIIIYSRIAILRQVPPKMEIWMTANLKQLACCSGPTEAIVNDDNYKD